MGTLSKADGYKVVFVRRSPLVLVAVAVLVLPVAVALVVVACWAGVLLPVVVRRRRRRSVVITMWYALTASRSSRRAWLAVLLAAPISSSLSHVIRARTGDPVVA